MNISTFFPSSWVWPAVGASWLVLFGALGAQTTRLQGTQRDFAQAQALWANERAKASEEQQQAEFEARLEEKRRYDTQKAIQDDIQHQLEMARAASANEHAVNVQLQQRFTALVAQSRKTSSDTVPAVSSASAQDASDLLSIVFGRVSDRASELAEYADQARLAGLACEASYKALEP